MLAVIFFLITLFAGWVLLGWLPLALRPLERLAAGSVAGILITSWLLFLTGWLFGYAVGVPVVAGVLVLFIAVSGRRYLLTAPASSPKLRFDQAFLLYLVGLGIVLLLIYFAHTHSLTIKPDGWYQSGYAWSDLPLHMSLISHAAYQPQFDFIFPVHYVESLSYPFLLDLYSGILLRLSSNWQLALFLPTVTLLLSLMQLILSVSGRLLGSLRAAWLHLFLLFASGSAGGLFLFFNDARARGLDTFSFKDYTNLGEEHRFYFANIVTSHLLPQRGFLIGFSTAMVVLLLIYATRKLQTKRTVLPVVIGIITGLLPFAHVHSFFMLALLLVTMTVTDMIREKRWQSTWLPALGIAVLIAAPQLYWQFTATYHESFGRWYLGWGTEKGGSVLGFWIKNWGIIFPFVFLNFFILRRWLRDRLLWQIYVVALAIFVAINIRIFQPNDFDNMKFLIYGYWGITLIMSYFLARMSRQWLGAIATIIIMVLSCGSGALALARETQIGWQEFSHDEIAFANTVREIVPVDARILTTERHNHPVPALTGRKILYGYPGWLWSYGFDIGPVGQDVGVMLSGGEEADNLLAQYKVTHVILSDQEVRTRKVNLQYFQNQHQLLAHDRGWYIFQVIID